MRLARYAPRIARALCAAQTRTRTSARARVRGCAQRARASVRARRALCAIAFGHHQWKGQVLPHSVRTAPGWRDTASTRSALRASSRANMTLAFCICGGGGGGGSGGGGGGGYGAL